jgi:hypothetical protein
LATLGLAGVTAIDCNAGAVTVICVEPVIPLIVALIVDDPVPAAVANPAIVIVATDCVAEAHVTEFVKSLVELSE